MIELGTKIIGDFGGYTEMWNGTVTGIIKSVNGVTIPTAAVMKWDDGSTTTIYESEIDSAPSVNGSPIGYYTEEAYYAS